MTVTGFPLYNLQARLSPDGVFMAYFLHLCFRFLDSCFDHAQVIIWRNLVVDDSQLGSLWNFHHAKASTNRNHRFRFDSSADRNNGLVLLR
ncbi:hypothetical protein LINPERHAP1_LOCUS21127 [Linum perenne]